MILLTICSISASFNTTNYFFFRHGHWNYGEVRSTAFRGQGTRVENLDKFVETSSAAFKIECMIWYIFPISQRRCEECNNWYSNVMYPAITEPTKSLQAVSYNQDETEWNFLFDIHREATWGFIKRVIMHQGNLWCEITLSSQTGDRGRATPFHTPLTHTNT